MSDPRIETAAKAIMDDNPFNDEAGLWEVPSIKAHYMAIARAALTAADVVDPLRGDGVIIVEIPEEPAGGVVNDYTFSPFGRGEEDSPEWHRTMDGQEWKGYKGGGKDYLSWPELVRRWGPLTVPVT
jgi:hypothetical protein